MSVLVEKRFSVNLDNLLYNTTLTFSILYMLRYSTLWEPYLEFAKLFQYLSLLLATILLGNSIFKYKVFEKLWIGILLLLTIYIGRKCGYTYPLYLTFALIIGAKHISYSKILKTHFYTCLSFCLFNFVGSLMGFIRNYIYIEYDRDFITQTQNVQRMSFGYDWTTDFASHVFLITMSYWLIRKGKSSIWEILGYLILSFFVINYTGTRASAICIIILALFSLYYKWYNYKKLEFSKSVWAVLVLSTPLFAVLSLFVVVYYDPLDFKWILINTLSTGRLHTCQNGFYEYGLSWFGQKIKMVGMGNIHLIRGAEYNYIDISYLLYFINRGIIATILLIMCYVIIGWKSYKSKNVVLALAASLSAFFGLFTQFHFNIAYCPLLLATFSDIDIKTRIKNLIKYAR